MHRVIQDSDDEDLPEEDRNNIPAAAVDLYHPSTTSTTTDSSKSVDTVHELHPEPQDTGESARVRGTDSSEKQIRNQLESAHVALFEMTPSGKRSVGNGVQAIASQSTQQNKLKRTKSAVSSTRGNGNSESPLENNNIKRRKTEYAYGSQSSKAEFGEVWDVPSSGGDKAGVVLGVTPNIVASGSDGLDSVGFLLHNPNEMFPISTGSMESRTEMTQILDVSQVQQLKSLVSTNSETPDDLENQETVDIERSQTLMTSGEMGTFDSAEHHGSFLSISTGQVGEDISTTLPANEEERDLCSVGSVTIQISQRQALSDPLDQTVVLETKIDGHVFADSDHSDNEQTEAVSMNELGKNQENSEANNAPTSNSEKSTSLLLKLPSMLPDLDNEHRVAVNGRTRKRKPEVKEVDHEAVEDELSLELPQEMYKPRPSRSRGSRIPSTASKLAKTVDAPKPTKTRLRRHKTTGAISAYSSSLREMGFRSSQVEEALADAGGNFDEALETLTKRSNSMFGGLQLSPQKSFVESKIAAIPEEEEEQEGEEVEKDAIEKVDHHEKDAQITTKNGDGCTNSEPTRRGRGRPKRQAISGEVNGATDGEEEETLPIVIDSTYDEASADPPSVLSKPAPKKPRGRPKKTSKPVAGMPIENDTSNLDVEDQQSNEAENNSRHGPAPANTDPTADPDGEQETTDTLPIPPPLPPSPPSSKENPPKSTSPTTKQDPSTLPATTTTTPKPPHSPLKTARVPLKVGLSRRARIEPLLRMTRK